MGDKTPPLTEGDVLDLLAKRHDKPGNGGSGEYAFLRHVRNAAGFSATRTFDAVAMSLYPSRGLLLHCFEVKCSRSDWLRELGDPAKADDAAKLCDTFSVVTSSASIVADGELPEMWGHYTARGNGIVTVKAPPRLPPARPDDRVSRSFLVSLLRAAGAARGTATPEDVTKARSEGFEAGYKRAEADLKAARAETHDLRETIRTFERESRVAINGWAARQNGGAAKVGAALRLVLESDATVGHAQARLREARTSLEHGIRHIDRLLEDGQTS